LSSWVRCDLKGEAAANVQRVEHAGDLGNGLTEDIHGPWGDERLRLFFIVVFFSANLKSKKYHLGSVLP
jgi:hypothetical protein